MVCMCECVHIDLILRKKKKKEKKVYPTKYKVFGLQASFQMSAQIFTIWKASVFGILERSAVIILTAYLK